VAGDFFVVITATFRTLYVFIVMEIGSRQILHQNAMAHPTAEWTLQQFREALPGDHPYRFVIHDRDRIFSADVDKSLTNLGVQVLRTPVRAQRRTRCASDSAAVFVANVSTRGSLAFEHGNLLAKAQDFQGRIGSRTEVGVECNEEGEEESEHELTIST